MCQRYWSLRHLRRVGFNDEELARVYNSSIRPFAEYCCPAFHSMMTDEQDQLLENAQVGALRATYGYCLSARKLRQKAGLETLRQGRIDLTNRIARRAQSSDRFSHWFPRNPESRSVRSRGEFKEFFATRYITANTCTKNEEAHYPTKCFTFCRRLVWRKNNWNLALTETQLFLCCVWLSKALIDVVWLPQALIDKFFWPQKCETFGRDKKIPM